MIISIETCLCSKPENYNLLDDLINLFLSERYVFFLKDENIFDTDWFKSSRPIKKEFLKGAFENSSKFRKPEIILSNESRVEDQVYELKDGLIFLQNPVLIFVENSQKDQNFLRSLFKNFKEGERAKLFHSKRWIEFRHLGGKNDTLNQLFQELRKYRRENLDNYRYLKIFILLDSDKKFPSDEGSHEDIIEFCEACNFSYHILYKREIENYFPVNLLDSNENVDSSKVQAFESMNENQKDFYDIEKGFNLNSYNKLPELYNDINTKHYKLLNKGFDHGEFKTKHEIPRLFLSNDVNKEILLKRCAHQPQPDELFKILTKINNLL